VFRLDRVNKGIIGHLQDGRKSYKKIAVALKVSENTVKTRVRKLVAEGILRIAGYVDPGVMESHQIAYLGVKLKDMDYLTKGEEISRLERVVSVAVVTGRFDLIVMVHLKHGFNLLRFLSEKLSKIDRIDAIETFMVYKGLNIKVPYIVDAKDMGEYDLNL